MKYLQNAWEPLQQNLQADSIPSLYTTLRMTTFGAAYGLDFVRECVL